MTDSFFQTCVHLDDVHLTVVTTLFGLYEWLAMPMGLHNSPAIHQRRMTAALHEHLGKICHIYLDDIIVWSDTITDHIKHIMVMKSLRDAWLYCNPDKCRFFKKEVDFLRHHISACRIEVNSSKIERILNWPVPKSATDVRGFLGLVRYIALFLPRLADYTCVLTPLEQSQRAEQDGSDGPTHYECGLSTCNVRVPIHISIRTSPTGPCTPPSQSVVPTLESPLRNVNVHVHDPNSPSKFRLSSQTSFWCPNFDRDYKRTRCWGHTNIA